MTDDLTTGQKKFNQRLLAEHCLEAKQVQSLWETLANEHDDMGGKDLKATMHASNQQLQHLGLEIVGVSLKINGQHQRYYAIVNKFPDDIAQKSFGSSAGEQALVRKVLQALVESDEGQLSFNTLVNLKNDLTDSVNLGTNQAYAVIKRLMAQKWLVEEKRSMVRLAPRTYMELSYMLKDHFGMAEEDLPQIIYT